MTKNHDIYIVPIEVAKFYFHKKVGYNLLATFLHMGTLLTTTTFQLFNNYLVTVDHFLCCGSNMQGDVVVNQTHPFIVNMKMSPYAIGVLELSRLYYTLVF